MQTLPPGFVMDAAPGEVPASGDLPPGFVLDQQPASAESQFVSGVATRFGYNDPQDNGVGAWGAPTNNPSVVGVSLSRQALRDHFGDENQAKGAMVEVVNPQTGARIVAPIVDKGPAGWVEDRQGPTIDLTHAADEMLGGQGKTPMQWRILGHPETESAPADAAASLPPGFQLDGESQAQSAPPALPPGFVLDGGGSPSPAVAPQAAATADLPPGFVLDSGGSPADASPFAQPLPVAPEHKVGFWEALGRSAGDSLLSVPEFVNRGLGVFPYLEDSAIHAVTGKDPGIYSAFDANMIAPLVAQRKKLQIQQGEKLTTGGEIGTATGGLARDVPLVMATGGLGLVPEAAGLATADAAPTLATAIRSLAPHFQRAMVNFAPSSAISGMDATTRSAEQGDHPVVQAAKGLATAALMDASAILPMGVPSSRATIAGRFVERAAKGYALSIPTVAVMHQAQSLIEGRPDLSPDWKDAVIGALPMAMLSGVGGGREQPAPKIGAAEMPKTKPAYKVTLTPDGKAPNTPETKASYDFIQSAPGHLEWGVISPEMAAASKAPLSPGPILIQQGTHENGNGFGWVHVADHTKEISNFNGQSVEGFVAETLAGFDQIWRQKNGRLLLVKKTGGQHDAHAIVELQPHDGFYGLTTAHPERVTKDLVKKGNELIWERSEPAAEGPGKPNTPSNPPTPQSSSSATVSHGAPHQEANLPQNPGAVNFDPTHPDAAYMPKPRSNSDAARLAELDAIDARNAKFVGELPERGLVVANKYEDGKIYVGKPGDLHFSVSERYSRKTNPNRGNLVEVGFVTPAGEFLSRKEALAWTNARKESVRPSSNMEGELDAMDYREQVKQPMASDLTPSPAAAAPAGEAFTHEQATLPRAIEWMRPETKGNPSPTKIRKYLRKALDIPIRHGMRVSKGAMAALGVYRIRPETIRMRALNDIPTLLHEVGHYLHHMVFPVGGNRGKASDFAKVFDSELMPLGARTSLPSYKPEMVRLEGVAEWFRTWVSDPVAARAAAPKFTSHFEEAIHRDYPQMEKTLAEVQRQVAAYIRQPSKVKAEEMIEWDESADDKPTLSEKLRTWYSSWVHELAPIERAMRELQSFGLDPAEAARVADLANNFKGGWRSKAEYDLEFQQTDLNGTVVGPGLKQILTKLRGHELREFSMYAALKRAEEKRAQGLRTGFEEVMKGADYPAMMRDWATKYEKRRKELVTFTENQMRMMEQSGFFTPGKLAEMRAMNQDYVPFHRIVESMGGGLRAGKTGHGFVNTDAGVRRFKGSDLMIADPLQSVIRNNMVFRELAERNRVGRLFVEAVRKVQGGGRIGETLLKPMKPTTVNHDEVLAALEAAGINTKGVKSAGVDLGFTIFRAAQGMNGKDGTFRVWIDGKDQLFQVEDRDLLRALTMMDSVDAEVFSKFPLLKPMAKLTSILRAGATLTPEFIVRNPFRDQVIAGVFSQHGFIPFWDGFRGVLSMLGKDHWYESWVRSGGKYGGLYDLETGNNQAVLEKLTRGDRNALQVAGALANPVNVLHALRFASEVMESGTRIGEFRRAKLAGKSDVEAANAARDVTLNFARSGYKGQIANKLVAFFNAAIQDMDKMQRTFRDRPVSTTLKSIALISIPSALVWWLGKDDEDIQSLPEWRKSFFWNINTGADFILSVPKPFLLGALFGTSVEKGLDYVFKRDPNALHKWFDAVIQNTLVRGDIGIATAFKPLVEDMTNYSFFRDSSLQDAGQMKLSPGLRANPDTSVSARWLGERVGLSPIIIDNTVRGYFGGLGRYGTNVVDWTMMHTGLADVAPQPLKDWRSLPGIKGVVVGADEPSAYVSRFYRALERAENRIVDFKEYGQQLRSADQSQFWNKNKNELAWYGAQAGDAPMITQLRRIRDQLGELNKAAAFVMNTRTMTSEQKTERLRLIQHQRDSLAKSAYDRGFHPTDRNAAF